MMQENYLSLNIQALPNIGKTKTTMLSRLGIYTMFDLLLHMPRLYIDLTKITPQSQIEHDKLAVLQGRIISAQEHINRNGKKTWLAVLDVGYASVTLRFFAVYESIKANFSMGQQIICYGKAIINRYNQIEIVHPEIIDKLCTHLSPIYPLTAGISNKQLTKIIDCAFELMSKYPPTDVLKGYEHYFINGTMPQFMDAVKTIHKPDTHEILLIHNRTSYALIRLVAEELVAHATSMLYAYQNTLTHSVPALSDKGTYKKLLELLPFKLTKAQERVILQIKVDLVNTEKEYIKPMLRLVQGDVGAGKTIIAAAASCFCVDAGKQVVIMVPTELLAKQHFKNFKAWADALSLECTLLVSSLKAKEKRQALMQIKNGASIIIGTHALFQDSVQYQNLGLVIIDEQHRFGVRQRLALVQKANIAAHQIIMTATPIPRTLAMSYYNTLDVSVIDELPPNRQRVTTSVISADKRNLVLDRIYLAAKSGKQIYWVCTLIDESETVNAQAATETFKQICEYMPDIRVSLVHGDMKSAERNATMENFAKGESSILVSTLVIEVGVDVPNAVIMVIEDANRLGLSSLHQLRGRVGRGVDQSFCVLMYQNPLSSVAKKRLEIIKQTNDGFLIAESDLKMRGIGEILGEKQSGEINFKIANPNVDIDIIENAQIVASKMFKAKDKNMHILMNRWLQDYKIFLNA